jgi:hypothetical protein
MIAPPLLLGAMLVVCARALASYYRHHAHRGPYSRSMAAPSLPSLAMVAIPHDLARDVTHGASPWATSHRTLPPGNNTGIAPQPTPDARRSMLWRLRKGSPALRDQLLFRLSGVAALGGFVLFLRWLCDLQAADPYKAASPIVLLACLGAVILLHLGTALTFIGPELLREAEQPSPASGPDTACG